MAAAANPVGDFPERSPCSAETSMISVAFYCTSSLSSSDDAKRGTNCFGSTGFSSKPSS